MNPNLTDSERSHLGAVNLDIFFSHLNFLADNPEVLSTIPNGSTIIYQGTGDAWVNAQNDGLATQAIVNGENIHRVIAPEKFSLTFPDGRRVIFNIDYQWTRHEVAQLTRLTIDQIRFLEREKIVVPSSSNEVNTKDKYFNFSQVLQLQAYKLILGDAHKKRGFGKDCGQTMPLRGETLQQLLEFYANYDLKGKTPQHCPVLFNGQIFVIAPDMSGSQELISLIPSLDWRSQSTRTATVYPPLFEVFRQLCENAWELRETQVWTQAELEKRLIIG